jgi:hypothetical protein
MVKLVKDKLQNSSIEQYKDEERAVLAKRIHSAENRKTTVANYGDDDVIARRTFETIAIRIVSLHE